MTTDYKLPSSQGLEWPLVILPELSEGSFPVIREGTGDAEIEDERRLFYVAVTCAKERLALVAPMDPALVMTSRTGATPPEKPLASRFLFEANGRPLSVASRGVESGGNPGSAPCRCGQTLSGHDLTGSSHAGRSFTMNGLTAENPARSRCG